MTLAQSIGTRPRPPLETLSAVNGFCFGRCAIGRTDATRTGGHRESQSGENVAASVVVVVVVRLPL